MIKGRRLLAAIAYERAARENPGVTCPDANSVDNSVLIFQGTAWEALDLQSKLEEGGIKALLVYLPHAAGHELYVPASRAAEAQIVLKSARKRATAADCEAEDDASRFQGVAKRIAVATFFLWSAPVGVAIGLMYLVRIRHLERKPPQHRDILVAIITAALVSVAACVVGVLVWVST